MMTSGVDEDRKLILSSPDELEPYLSSKVLFWRVQGSSLPLCPGNLLLALKKYRSQDFSPTEAIAVIDNVIKRKQQAWENKAGAELTNRIEQWKNLVEEFEEDSRIDASYRYNVRVRAIITLLDDALRYKKIDQEYKLAELDEKTRYLVNHGEFIWEDVLRSLFPEENFWYLYVKI